MPKRIYKYEFPLEQVVPLSMPVGSKPLSAQLQRGTPCIWMEVDTDQPEKMRCLYIFGTGYEFDPMNLTFVATVQMDFFVWHIYIADEEAAS